jgi:hypothetical protein
MTAAISLARLPPATAGSLDGISSNARGTPARTAKPTGNLQNAATQRASAITTACRRVGASTKPMTAMDDHREAAHRKMSVSASLSRYTTNGHATKSAPLANAIQRPLVRSARQYVSTAPRRPPTTCSARMASRGGWKCKRTRRLIGQTSSGFPPLKGCSHSPLSIILQIKRSCDPSSSKAGSDIRRKKAKEPMASNAASARTSGPRARNRFATQRVWRS